MPFDQKVDASDKETSNSQTSQALVRVSGFQITPDQFRKLLHSNEEEQPLNPFEALVSREVASFKSSLYFPELQAFLKDFVASISSSSMTIETENTTCQSIFKHAP